MGAHARLRAIPALAALGQGDSLEQQSNNEAPRRVSTAQRKRALDQADDITKSARQVAAVDKRTGTVQNETFEQIVKSIGWAWYWVSQAQSRSETYLLDNTGPSSRISIRPRCGDASRLIGRLVKHLPLFGILA